MRLSGEQDPRFGELIRLLSYHTRNGHVCINLRHLPGGGPGSIVSFPQTFIRKLTRSALVGSDRQADRPLVLAEDSLLYFRRFREYELRTAARLRNLALPDRAAPSGMPSQAGPERAAALAAWRKLVVITGGPGTGKTTTTARILVRLLGDEPQLRLLIAAPTGKAAMRLRDSLSSALALLDVSDELRARIPEVTTLHRLLGSRTFSARYRRNNANPLPCELLVIDEASMVDLPLFAAVLDALPKHARLVLSGDRYQLASVEAGTVLGDLCSVSDQPEGSTESIGLFSEAGTLRECIVELQKNYRFAEDSGIAMLASAVRSGDAKAAGQILASGSEVVHLSGAVADAEHLGDCIAQGYAGLADASDPQVCLQALESFRILCAHRRGPGGVAALNELATEVLLQRGILTRTRAGIGGLQPLPILVTRNDYRLRLFNGDMGVLMYNEDGEALVHFSGNGDEPPRALPPERLPEHEVCFAMTVHKSQGSEFDRALLVLPEEVSPVLTRELVYTAITRARFAFLLFGDLGVFQAAVGRAVKRTSGLRRALLSG